MSNLQTNSLTNPTKGAKIKPSEPRVWREVRDAETGKLLFRHCPQGNLVEIVKDKRRTVVSLPQA